MKTVQVGNLKTAYEKVGSGPIIILLHGWANTWEAWLPIIPILSDHFTLILPDLPGFGNSEGPTNGWTTSEYCDWLCQFIEIVVGQKQDFTLIGHSYGGKISALYQSSNRSPKPKKLILIDSSGIPSSLSLSQHILHFGSTILPKKVKQHLSTKARNTLYTAFGAESDYLHANKSQQQTLSKILGEDITKQLPFIQTPTLLIWGTQEKFPPLEHGVVFNLHIKGSILKIFESGHFPHHEDPSLVAKEIIEFVQDAAPISTPEQNLRKPSLETKLAILQQSEYDWKQYRKWIRAHTFVSSDIEPKVWTTKLRLMQRYTRVLSPVIGIDQAMHLINLLFYIPLRFIIRLSVFIATIKLRYLQKRGLIVVAIAGSYAKTSTKYIANHLISSTHTTLMTPENINTPIGIARVILSSLHGNHTVFLAELGEYYPKDIERLTRFLHPRYKILTPIGHAHLEKFKTTKRLEKGLLELILTLPEIESCVHAHNETLFTTHRVPTNHTFFYGEQYIHNVSISRAGTEFDISSSFFDHNDHTSTASHTFIPLLGSHFAINALAGVWLGLALGIDKETLLRRLQTAPIVPHRLEPSLLSNNIMLLDNGYNSNPSAATESIHVLKQVTTTQTIVITPGFVDMGEMQFEENEKFGKLLGESVTMIVVIEGVNTKALLKGIESTVFDTNNLLRAKNEQMAMQLLQGKIVSGATILFENSVPELYK